MALVVNDLAIAMQNSVNGMTEPTIAPLGIAIGSYIVSNAELDYDWTGVNTVAPFDTENIPTTGEILTHSISLTLSEATAPVEGLTHLASEITTGIRSATYNITAPGWSTAPLPCSDIPDLALSIDGTDIRESAFSQLASQICDWIWAYAPAAPNAGSHGTYVGTGTVSAIN